MEAAKYHRYTFGAVLYLNGEHIYGKKTLKKCGWFKGFKKGDGQYNEFLFQLKDYGHLGSEEQKSDQEEQPQK